MVEIKITVKSVQTTDEGTLVIEMSPYPYARWIQTEALADANVAVQPYGVIMVPEAATFTPGGLTVDVEVKGYVFSVPLATLMEADAEDQIEFISPYITVADLADVDLTNLQNGQTLIWDSTNNVWVNGSAGGGGGEPLFCKLAITYVSADNYEAELINTTFAQLKQAINDEKVIQCYLIEDGSNNGIVDGIYEENDDLIFYLNLVLYDEGDVYYRHYEATLSSDGTSLSVVYTVVTKILTATTP